MKKIKRILRMTMLVVMIILASVGIGLTGAAPIFSGKREPFLNKTINIEQVEDKEEDDETMLKKIA